jgi:cell division protein FtsQ
MQPLIADARPISHYRNGKLRGDDDGPLEILRRGRKDPEVAPGLLEQPRRSWRTDLRPMAKAAARQTRRDPAPSRWAYRMDRLRLTPLFRVVVGVGLPIAAIVIVVVAYFGDADRRAAIVDYAADMRTQFENRPEFLVKLMAIDGASAPVADAIRAMLPVTLPASSFAIDLEAMRATIEQIDAVADARIKVRAGGVLAVDVTERKPAILWRTDKSLEMLDAGGHRVATLLDRNARPDLPVVAGKGAESNVPEALAILNAAQPILPRVRGLVRMGERRWDIVLDRDQRILLPEDDPVAATEQAMAIEAAEAIFARDMADLDLRNSARPTVRLTATAMEAMRQLTENLTKVAGE